MTNSERAAYIRGLMEGLDLDPNAKETKLFNAIVDLLDDLCLSVEEMEDAYDELSGQVDETDEDLGEPEEDYYDLDDFDDEEDEDDDWEEDDDDCYFEVTCPSCGDTIQLNGEMLEEGSIECPNCGENLEFDLDEEECGCGEDCNCEEKE